MRALDAKLCPISEVKTETVRDMFAIFAAYYDAVSFENFREDLQAKDRVILLLDDKGTLCGFTTMKVMEYRHGDVDCRAIFSGDTILREEYWGDQLLPKAWCRAAGAIKAEEPGKPLYWFLIVKGHRTYRYLPVFTREYYPHHEKPTPARFRELMRGLASSLFGSAYDQGHGIVTFDQSRGHLRKAYAEVSAHQLRNRHIACFLRLNPGYGRGDELVCIAELSPENMRFHARQSFVEGFEACPGK